MMICKIYCIIANMSNLHCQLPEARNALPTADCVSAEQTKVVKPNYVSTDCISMHLCWSYFCWLCLCRANQGRPNLFLHVVMFSIAKNLHGKSFRQISSKAGLHFCWFFFWLKVSGRDLQRPVGFGRGWDCEARQSRAGQSWGGWVVEHFSSDILIVNWWLVTELVKTFPLTYWWLVDCISDWAL